MKAATAEITECDTDKAISIHAAREGGDMEELEEVFYDAEFQSTPPVKAATLSVSHSVISAIFQSTPPVKAATISACIIGVMYLIFQSTPPVKAAT